MLNEKLDKRFCLELFDHLTLEYVLKNPHLGQKAKERLLNSKQGHLYSSEEQGLQGEAFLI